MMLFLQLLNVIGDVVVFHWGLPMHVLLGVSFPTPVLCHIFMRLIFDV
jgi:hypothetical protein